MQNLEKKGPVLFFDGDCSLCSRWVAFVVKWEKVRGEIQCVAAGAPEAGQWLDAARKAEARDTVLWLEEGVFYRRSSAVLRIARRLKGFWILGWVGLVVPRVLRDRVYDFVAAHRR